MLLDDFRRFAATIFADLLGLEKNVVEVDVEREIGNRLRFVARRRFVKILDRFFHVLDREVGLAERTDRRFVAELVAEAIDVAQLLHRRPVLVLLAPVPARSQPDRECFREIFVGMLLRVPAGDMTNVIF